MHKLRDKIKTNQLDDLHLIKFLYEPITDTSFIFSPPVEPSQHFNKIFKWDGKLDKELDGFYLVKYGNYNFCFKANFPLKDARFNMYIKVIGKYFGNVEFVTIFGERIKIPCLDALFVR